MCENCEWLGNFMYIPIKLVNLNLSKSPFIRFTISLLKGNYCTKESEAIKFLTKVNLLFAYIEIIDGLILTLPSLGLYTLVFIVILFFALGILAIVALLPTAYDTNV